MRHLSDLLLPAVFVLTLVSRGPAQEEPAAGPSPADKQQIEAALKLTREAAGSYSFKIDDAAAELLPEPVLRWSNPAAGEIHGNVFLWTLRGRPVVVGSLFKWFSPHTHMSHEFHSLVDVPIRGSREKSDVWITDEPGVEFKPVPSAEPPGKTTSQRLLQMRQIARGFTARRRDRAGDSSELRLLPQPIYRYELPREGVVDGALFAFVQGTDPEVFLLLEARQSDDAASWEFGLTRMNSLEFQVSYKNVEIWSVEIMPWSDVNGHRKTYTTFQHKTLP